MHDYENGHTCPTCHKTGILCTIEDGFCENEGECNDCIKERVCKELDYEYGYKPYCCRHGFPEGEECPLCEHLDGQHEEEYVGEDWLGPEYPCPMCDGYSEAEADNIFAKL